MTAPAILALYKQLDAPPWAAPNLDALLDVLRDLSWLPEGPVVLTLPDLSGLGPDERRRLEAALRRAVQDAAGSARPLDVRGAHW